LFQTSTTSKYLLLKLLQVNPFQLAAPSAPPELDDPMDVAVRVHETMVGNFSEGAISGVTLTDERLAELLEEYTGEIPEELQVTPETDPWSITFDSSQPVSARFNDGSVRIAVRGRRFTRNEQELRDLVEIWANYQIDKTPNGVKLIRDGDVQVDFPRRGSLGISQVAFRQFLKKKFEAMFKPEFASDGIALPERWADAGELKIRSVKSGNGWLAVVTELSDDKVAARTAAIEEQKSP
jgi:hypothetical protein